MATSQPAQLRDKALTLHEAANTSRAHMIAQKERLESLRREIAQLKSLVGQAPVAAPPAPVLRRIAPVAPARVRSVPVVKEAASVSAAAAASLRTGSRYDSWKPVPYIAIFFVAVGMQLHASGTAPARRVAAEAPVAVPVAPAVEDGNADEAQALMLTHEWRLPGDERTLSDRLGANTNPPGAQPQWTAERTGEHTYRVSFKPGRADIGYDFDVDLTARRVDPTPETAELISPRLVSRR